MAVLVVGGYCFGRYLQGYHQIKTFCDESLDIYRHELSLVLFPLFVHSYLDLVAKAFPEEAGNFLSEYRKDHEHAYSTDIKV